MKAAVMTEPTHNPPGEARRASCLRENFTSSSYGEGLETDRKAPRQLLTRQLFFRWIKQHLRLRGFFSNDPNGVRVQVWTAICAYLLVAIAKKENALRQSLHQVLQVVSLSCLEKVPLIELLAKHDTTNEPFDIPIQLEINGF